MYDDEFEIGFVIDVLAKEIAYARSCLLPHDTGHISTSIGWMEKRKKDLERQLSTLKD